MESIEKSLCQDEVINGIRVLSLFQLKDGVFQEGGGNPVLQALKNEDSRQLTAPEVVRKRVDSIADRLFETNGGSDVTIMIPFDNNLDACLANVMAVRCTNPLFVPDVMVNMSLEEVDNYVYEEDSYFRQYYGNEFLANYRKFRQCCSEMDNGFQFRKVGDVEMRCVIGSTVRAKHSFYGSFIDAVNDKNVVIVDTSITLVRMLEESCSLIREHYLPKSISVITLFFPRCSDDGAALSV